MIQSYRSKVILSILKTAIGLYGVKKGVDAKKDYDDAERYVRWAKEEADKANEKLEKQKRKTRISLENYGVLKKEGIENISLFNSFICYSNGESRTNHLRVSKNFDEYHPKIILTKEEEIQILKELHIIDNNLTNAEAEQKISLSSIDMGKLRINFTSVTGAYLIGGIPLLAIGGIILSSKAAAKKDEAYEHLSRVRGEIKKLDVVSSKLGAIATYTDECCTTFNKLNSYWTSDLLLSLEKLAKRGVMYKELSTEEKHIVKANYEMNYLLYSFIKESTVNRNGDDVLPKLERKALQRVNNLECIALPK